MVRWLLGRADVVCTFGSTHARFLRSIGCPRVEEIETLLPEAALQPFPRCVAAPPRIVFAGRAVPEKGLDLLLRALPLVTKPCELHVAGNVAVPSLIASRGDEDPEWNNRRPTVVIHGVLAEEDFVSLLRSASLVVLPSSAELWPLVILEALAVGVPVIATPLPTVGEIADKYGGVVTTTRSAPHLAAAIDAALTGDCPAPASAALIATHAWPTVIRHYERLVSSLEGSL